MVGPNIKSATFLVSLLLAGLALGWALQLIDRLFGFPKLLPYPINFAGLAIIAFGSWMRLWAGAVFYRQNPSMVSFNVPPKLVTTGPWRYSRNPLYLGLIMIGLGFSIFFSSYSDLIFTLVGAVLLHLEVVMHEEEVLTQKFGNVYLDYKKQIRRWI
jgi:protein-S-isoprenylcysteine O-methyltransferase Ste14